MKKKTKDSCIIPMPAFYGTSSVGERGQVVIPKKARMLVGIKPGDNMMFFGTKAGMGIIIIKSDIMNKFISRITSRLEQFRVLGKGKKR